MKKIFILTCNLVLAVCSFSQEFPGLRSGNFTGVNGVFSNPANIVDSRYRFDFNLFSVSTGVGNNKASFSLKDIATSLNGDSLTNQLFSNEGGLNSAMVNMDFRGPSLMFNTGKKMSVALTTRARAVVNIIDFDGPFAKQIMDDVGDEFTFPYSVTSGADMRFAVNAWTEFGLSVARIISDEGKHFFKAGATLKYLSGAGNGYFNISQLRGTLNEDALGDVYLSNSSGRISTGFGGLELSDIEPADFTQFSNGSIGADLGVVYEHRPDFEKYKTGSGYRNDRNKYKFKVGLSLLDLGSVKYQRDMQTSGAYTVDISGNERFYFRELEDKDPEEYNAVFRSRPQFFTASGTDNSASYMVSLPTTLQVDFDYHIKGGLYASLAAQLPFTNDKIYNNRMYTGFTLTPRYEGRALGLYVPLNYNSLTDFNAGLSLRLGPLFIGSGSLLTALVGESKQADVHVGFHIAGLRRKTKA